MPNHTPEYHTTTIHEFKSNIARYIRALEAGRYRGIIVKRYHEPVGAFILHPDAAAKREAREAQVIKKHEASKTGPNGSAMAEMLDIISNSSGPDEHYSNSN